MLLSRHIACSFVTLRIKYRSLIGACPRHENEKFVLPLQAADMLAWHIRREQADQGTDWLETPAWEIFTFGSNNLSMTQSC